MKKNTLKYGLFFGFAFFSLFVSAQTAPDEDGTPYTTCNVDGANATKTSNDLTPRVNVGSIDDRSCYANYKESSVYGKTWGIYNITYDSNNQDAVNTLQPRIERSLSRSQEIGVGSFAKFTGTVRILEVGDTSGTNNDGTYIMQAKGKHTGGGGSADPAICLYLAKPVYGDDGNGNQVQVSFDIYREQINYRGGSGAVGRDIIFLKNVLKNAETTIELTVGFRQDPSDSSKRIHYADAVIGGETFNFNIPEPERGTESGIRYGAYRVKGGRAQIRWADTTYQKVENELSEIGVSITSLSSGDWDAGATWVGGVVPTALDNVTVASDHILNINDGINAVSNNLITGGGSSVVNVRAGGTLIVNGDITITRFDNGFKVWADTTKEGVFVLKGNYTADDGTSSKRIAYERVLEESSTDTSARKWFLISNPFKELTKARSINLSDVFTNASSQQSIGVYDNSNTAGSKYEYRASADGSNLVDGKGYTIALNNGGSAVDYEFRGFYNHDLGSTAEIAITRDATQADGFNLIGNPYLSYIYANNSANETHNILLDNAAILEELSLYLWDGNASTWSTKNHSDAAFSISPGQGFFVESNVAGGNFVFDKDLQTISANGGVFQKSTNNRFEIDLSIKTGKLSRKTSIRYIDGTSTAFDNGYDSSMFGGYASTFAVYTNLVVGNSDKKLAIQSLPNSNFENMVIPVGVTVAENSEIIFSAEALNVPAGYKVFLEDRLNKTFIRLDEANTNYTVIVSEKSIEGRFYIHTRSAALSLDTVLLNSISIYKSNTSTLKIVGLSQGKTNVKLFNVLGKQVMNSNFNAQGVKELSLPSLAKGVYIVQLETQTGKLNKKIVIE